MKDLSPSLYVISGTLALLCINKIWFKLLLNALKSLYGKLKYTFMPLIIIVIIIIKLFLNIFFGNIYNDQVAI